MSSKKQIKRENIDFKRGAEFIKKDPGINVMELKNREKAAITIREQK